MKTCCRNLVCVGAVLALGTWLARATDPAPLAPPAAAPAKSGKVLVLSNDQTREGDIERVGDQYRVRHTVGETWVPAGQVVCLCQSLEDAYQFLRRRANLEDADERLRLANWCRDNDLRAQALEEIRAAVRLRPGHAASRRLLAYLEQATAPVAGAAPAIPEPPEPAVAIDLTTESLGQFASQVQPLLMNACANCHAVGRGGAFRLTRAYESTTANRKTLRRNLAAVLAQVRPRLEASPLLVKAVSAHGPMNQAAIRDRQAKAYRILEDWLRKTLASNPQLAEALAALPAARPAVAPSAPVAPPPPPAHAGPAFGEDSGHARKSLVAPPAVSEEKATAPPSATGPADAYSPDEFNRRMHPGRTPPPAPKP